MEKILLIEDDTRISELVKRGLEENNFEVLTAFDGEFGKKLALNQKVNLIIADIMLPKLDGLSLVKEVRRMKSKVPIIMLTALGATDDKLEGFDAGADDYMVKPFDIRELIARVNLLLNRTSKEADETLEELIYEDLKIDLNLKEFYRSGDKIRLTPKEYKLMEYLMKNPNRVLSRNEISEKVWETNFDTGTNFIDVYINYLRKKVDKNYKDNYIQTQTGMGFVLKKIES